MRHPFANIAITHDTFLNILNKERATFDTHPDRDFALAYTNTLIFLGNYYILSVHVTSDSARAAEALAHVARNARPEIVSRLLEALDAHLPSSN